MCRIAVLLVLAIQVGSAQAAPVTVKNLRMWQAPDHTRLVFDLSAPVEYDVGVLTGPHRVYLDFPRARLARGLPSIHADGRFVKKVHSGSPRPGVLRVVFTLKMAAEPKVFHLKPNEVYGHRLVMDLRDRVGRENKTIVAAPGGSDNFIVAIDAGHGGEDPGAMGSRRTREKDITLAIARELQRLVGRDPAMQGILTRNNDYYVSLRRRTKIARSAKSNLFVSIHADAFPQRSVRGSSVYTLSTRGASSETARWLSNKENAADLIGGVSLRDKDDTVARVLMDLSMTKSTSDSRELARDILRGLRRVGRVHRNRVEYANFAVLKSPDIPSVLVESAFLSNPREESLLRTGSHRRKVAAAIYEGIRRYYERRHPGARPAVYVVKRGDTLSEIAQQYRISVNTLKKVNNMSSDVVRIGQKLRIPSG
ncbi:MAG: N-acetylmuramoyl-L-alanine amidase AmiC [Gammaproteobacteria bacterium]|nr:N-acetylmuramoyl-L-alanine amidase AmiC [Gammaproteobacteria bacterium]